MSTGKTAHFLIAMDSFKGSASSLEVANAVKAGLLRVQSTANVTVVPIADGGEGTVETLVTSLGGNLEQVLVQDPLGKPILAEYGILQGNIAVIEMAAASGLTLISESHRDPLRTSTYGTGQLIASALGKGLNKILVGIGGSATNDGGIGMAQALGISFVDKLGREIGPGAAGIIELDSIDFKGLFPSVRDAEIIALTDVTNPLCGEKGASQVFGLQKGARPEELIKLDQILHHLAEIVYQTTGKDHSTIPGSGAAGGLGFGLLSFCGAEILPGLDTILDLLQIDNHIRQADCVITGEGRLDEQTLYGKVPLGIAAHSKKFDLPVIAIVGSCEIDKETLSKLGIDLVFELVRETGSIEEAIQNALSLAERAGERSMHAYLSGRLM